MQILATDADGKAGILSSPSASVALSLRPVNASEQINDGVNGKCPWIPVSFLSSS